MKTRLAVVGFSGRMGREIASLVEESEFEVIAGISRGKTNQSIAVYERIDLLPAKNVDVVIDFSLPALAEQVAAFCAENKLPLVSGVTGLEKNQRESLEKAARETAVLWAPNMSLGVAVLARALKNFNALAGDFEFQIEEVHHKRKKDRPSGTALFLQEKLSRAVGHQPPEPLAIRGGGVFGLHRVWALGEEETLTFEHNALNRRVFARGALKAASWIRKKPAGLYSMDDVLG